MHFLHLPEPALCYTFATVMSLSYCAGGQVMMSKVKELARLMMISRKTVAYTGAGRACVEDNIMLIHGFCAWV